MFPVYSLTPLYHEECPRGSNPKNSVQISLGHNRGTLLLVYSGNSLVLQWSPWLHNLLHQLWEDSRSSYQPSFPYNLSPIMMPGYWLMLRSRLAFSFPIVDIIYYEQPQLDYCVRDTLCYQHMWLLASCACCCADCCREVVNFWVFRVHWWWCRVGYDDHQSESIYIYRLAAWNLVTETPLLLINVCGACGGAKYILIVSQTGLSEQLVIDYLNNHMVISAF